VTLFSQCRYLEIGHDSVDTADSPRIKLGIKLRLLNGVNWQRREELLLAGKGGALGDLRITDRSLSFFNVAIAEIEIFIDDHFPLNNVVCTGLSRAPDIH
jgi:hypothetical protein